MQQILPLANQRQSATDWQPDNEAKLFAEEAEWALRWQLYPTAQSASDAAWALGLRSKATCLLRLKSYLIPVDQITHTPAVYRTPAMTAASAVDLIKRGLEVFLDSLSSLPQRGEKIDPLWIGCGVDVLHTTADVLKMLYEIDPDQAGTVSASDLQEVRALARELAARQTEAATRCPEAKQRRPWPYYYPWKGDEVYAGTEMCTIQGARVWFSGLWQENPALAFQEYRDLFYNREQLPPEVRKYTDARHGSDAATPSQWKARIKL